MRASSQVMDLVRANLDPSTAKLIEDALESSERISIIRDAFLEGRDLEAVKMLRDLDPVGLRKILSVSSNQPIHVGSVCQITARPQLPFTPNRLMVALSCARSFRIEEIQVGRHSMFVQAGSLAAELFAVDAPVFKGELDDDGFFVLKIGAAAESRLGIPIDMPEVLPGMQITVVVTNIDDDRIVGIDGIEFSAALLGTTRAY